MELEQKTNLLKHFQKVYNNEISGNNKITNHELECYIEEYLAPCEISLKFVSDQLKKRLSCKKNIDVADTGIKQDRHYVFKRNICGHIRELYYDVYFKRDNEGNYEIEIGRMTECEEQINKMILSIEPRAVITIK